MNGISDRKKRALIKALRYWLASCALVVGFFYYKSNIPLGPVLIAIIGTFIVTMGRVLLQSEGNLTE